MLAPLRFLDHFAHRFDVGIDQELRPAGRVEDAGLVDVDAEVVVERREDFLELDRAMYWDVRPGALVAPITWPVRMPPPASSAQLTCGQWSRLLHVVDARRAAELAPDHDGDVLIQPARVQVLDQGGQGRVQEREVRRPSGKFMPSPPCQSQRLKLSVTTRAPASTSRRARQEAADHARGAVAFVGRIVVAVARPHARVFLA